MAASNDANGDAQPTTEPTVEKDVTIIGYGQDPDMDEREFADRHDEETDYYEKDTVVSTKHYIRYKDDEGEEREEWITESSYQALVGDANQRDPNSSGYLVEETTEKTRYKHNPSAFARMVRNDAWGDLPDELSHDVESDFFTGRYQDDKGETKVRVDSDTVATERILVHQSERGGLGEMHETDEEYPAVKLAVSLEGTEEEVADWSEEVVKPLMEYVAGVEGIGKVRLTDCKTKVEREGDCYGM